MFYEIFHSPQINRWVIITYKHGIYELPHELRNDSRFRILGNEKISGTALNVNQWLPSAQSPSQSEGFVYTSRKLLENKS